MGEAEMARLANSSSEAGELVMRLREELVEVRSELVDTKQQNELLRQVVRELKTSRDQLETDLQEDQLRLVALESSVRQLKGCQKGPDELGGHRHMSSPTVLAALEEIKKEVRQIKNPPKRSPPIQVSSIPKNYGPGKRVQFSAFRNDLPGNHL